MKIAIMGFGTVGSGVKEVLELNREQVEKKGGDKIEIKYILARREHIPGVPDELITTDFSVIEKDPEVELVVEAIGGIHPAYEYIMSCLEKGKHVVSSNKAVVDACGSKLMRTAKEHNCNFYFEASVGGGIPVIRTLYHNYAGENVTEITGILNGTSNFILSKMKDEGSTFADTLKEAQRLGYAEKDPSADVDGFADAVVRVRHDVKYCKVCHNLSDDDVCGICSDPRRDGSVVCVVENVQDVMAIENTQQFHGLYHVLGGIISPMDGIGPNDLEIDSLVERVKGGTVKEVILALASTMEGDTTNFYISRKLRGTGVKLSVIARGISVGDELEYTDEVTLGRSILNRTPLES